MQRIVVIALMVLIFGGDAVAKGRFSNKITYIDKVSLSFDILSVKHTDLNTIIECGYDDHINDFSSVIIENTLYLEDYHTKEVYQVEKIKGIEPSKTRLKGVDKITLYFPPLEGSVRECNIYGGEGHKSMLIEGLMIDEFADLKIEPKERVYGEVSYDSIKGFYVDNPEYKLNPVQYKIGIDRVECIDGLVIATFNINGRMGTSMYRRDIDLNPMNILNFTPTINNYYGLFIDPDPKVLWGWEEKSYAVNMNDTHAKSSDTGIIDGLHQNGELVQISDKKGKFRLYYRFDGGSYPEVMTIHIAGRDIRGTFHCTFSNIELSE